MTDVEIVRLDLAKHGAQDSWDWQADLRFAEAVGDEEAVKDCKDLLKSHAPFPTLIMFHRLALGRIQQRRVRALRLLVRAKEVRAWWLGTGPYGRTEFGVNRVRHYETQETAGV